MGKIINQIINDEVDDKSKITNEDQEADIDFSIRDSIENKIICANSLEILKKIPSKSIPLILTDIPYGVVNRSSGGIRTFDKDKADIVNFDLEELAFELERISSGSIYIFCSTEQVSFLRGYLAEKKMTTRLCIWEKTNPSPVNCQYVWMNGIETCVFARKSGSTFNEHYKNSVWRFPSGRRTFHPTQKPLALFEYLIQTSSNEGDLVLDPFSGSGTTAVAAKKLNRKYLCIELDQEFVDLSISRVNGAING
jgi:DNA modification methylase